MEKSREYTHDDMARLSSEIQSLRMRAREVDQAIRNGAISHEQWLSAAEDLMARKNEILDILADVERYKSELRNEIKKERELRIAAEKKIAVLRAETGSKEC